MEFRLFQIIGNLKTEMAEGEGNTTESEDLFATDDRKLSAGEDQGIYSID